MARCPYERSSEITTVLQQLEKLQLKASVTPNIIAVPCTAGSCTALSNNCWHRWRLTVQLSGWLYQAAFDNVYEWQCMIRTFIFRLPIVKTHRRFLCNLDWLGVRSGCYVSELPSAK